MSSARRLMVRGCIAAFNVYAAVTATNFALVNIATSDLSPKTSIKKVLISCAHARLSNAVITPIAPHMMESLLDPVPTMARNAGIKRPEMGPARSMSVISLFVKPMVRRWGLGLFCQMVHCV